jgi:hypothetical protein
MESNYSMPLLYPPSTKEQAEKDASLLESEMDGRSGKQRRRIRRARERYDAKRQAAGQRAYNREQRKLEYRAGTRRGQLAILKGEVQVSPDMARNLTRAIEREQRRAEREPLAGERKQEARQVTADMVDERRHARFAAGKPRGKDLRSRTFEAFAHLLPLGYAGKGGAR